MAELLFSPFLAIDKINSVSEDKGYPRGNL